MVYKTNRYRGETSPSYSLLGSSFIKSLHSFFKTSDKVPHTERINSINISPFKFGPKISNY